MNNINIASYNCKNVKSSIQEIQELCDSSDIIFLQETWLSEAELPVLNQIRNDFYSKGLSAMDLESGMLVGRPHGGIAALWRKSLAYSIKPILYDDARLMALELISDTVKILLVNVYMPCSSHENREEFIYYLSKLDSIVAASDTPYCMVIGDFNADMKTDERGDINQVFGELLKQHCTAEKLLITDHLYLQNQNPYTFYSASHGSTSWLDHVVCTATMHELIQDVCIKYKYVTSDHFPITASIDIDVPGIHLKKRNQPKVSKVKWEKLSDTEIEQYTNNTRETLNTVHIQHDLLGCRNPSCKNEDHITALDKLYEDIVGALLKASSPLQTHCTVPKSEQIPGWNDYCKEMHSNARESFLYWRENGSPRTGPLFRIMTNTRAQFKRALRRCHANEKQAIADSLAKKLLLKDTNSFWNGVKDARGQTIKVQATVIDGVTGSENITDMWMKHFKSLLNSTHDNVQKNRIAKDLSSINKIDITSDLLTYTDVIECIKYIKKGKASGTDCISSEHLMYANPRICFYLCCLFNSMIVHGHCPLRFMDTLIVTLVKDKKGVLTDKNNYRPIAITSSISKLLERVLLKKYGEVFVTNSHQFGYKQKHSTDMCIFLMKEVIDFYNTLSSPVYVCYMDASKAFDRINHGHLFQKLLDRNLPPIIVRLLLNWFSTQQFSVLWDGVVSVPFKVTNGVRQGGVLSPQLFNVYMDELSNNLKNVRTGCHINATCINHLYYADDAVLLAPTVSSLQCLVDICQAYADKFDITYNVKKSHCMAFMPNSCRKLDIPSIMLGTLKLAWIKNHKYLGVIFSDKFTDDLDMERQAKSLYLQGNITVNKFRNCTDDVKLQLFHTYCTNMYAAHLWSNFTTEAYNKVCVAYNNIFRALMDVDRRASISAALVLRNVPTFTILLRKMIYGFYVRMLKSDNLLVTTIMQSPFFIYSSRINARWHKLLY